MEQGTEIGGVKGFTTCKFHAEDALPGFLDFTERGNKLDVDAVESKSRSVTALDSERSVLTTKCTWVNFRFGSCEILLQDGRRSLASMSTDIPFNFFPKCLLHMLL